MSVRKADIPAGLVPAGSSERSYALEKRKEAVVLGTVAALSWRPAQLTWRCYECNKVEGQDTGEYTDGVCVACLWTNHTELAVPVLTSIVAEGKPLH